MPPAIRRALLAALALSGCTSGAPSTFSDTASPRDASDECLSLPRSCDDPPPQLARFDPQRNCLAERAALTDVCATVESRCFRTLGIIDECAISPAGDVYVGWIATDVTLTASGWTFLHGFQKVGPCADAMCAPACPGVTLPMALGCFKDAGAE